MALPEELPQLLLLALWHALVLASALLALPRALPLWEELAHMLELLSGLLLPAALGDF